MTADRPSVEDARADLHPVIVEHQIIGTQTGTQGAGQVVPEDSVLCTKCGWMRCSDYTWHLSDALAASRAVPSDRCECPPCPGRGNDGHGMNHCAECCFGTGVEADPGCPEHGQPLLPGEAAARAGMDAPWNPGPPDEELAVPSDPDPCPTPGCTGNDRYLAPGRGHDEGCTYPAVPSDHTATTEDAARIAECVLRERIGGHGRADYPVYAEAIVSAFRAAGLLATARPDATTEPTDAQVAAAAEAFEQSWNEGVAAESLIDDPDAFIRQAMRHALRAAWTEAGR